MEGLKVVDLCAGTGAFSSILESKGCRVIFSNDMDPASKIFYDANHKAKMFLGDICQVPVDQIEPHDILTAGFPCQPFSIAGNRKGFEDPRSNVFWKIMEILRYHKPSYVFLENVKNLVTHDGGKTFKTIIESLETLYHVSYKVLDTYEVTGIPQHRERIYIVATKDPHKSLSSFHIGQVDKIPFKELLEEDVHKRYIYDDRFNCYDNIKESIIKDDTFYQYRRTLVRENKSGICPTLTANMGTGGHNVPLILNKGHIRKITPKECFALQGFPSNLNFSNLSDSKLYKLAGNAISPPVFSKVVEWILQE